MDAVGNELAPVELGEKAPKVLKGYNTVSTSKKDGITTHVYGVEKDSVKSSEKVAEKANVSNSERKLPNTGLNSVTTALLGVVALLAALVLRKRKNR
ncbi:MAG: LPXTG cell wall anchor domain-containing protein [Gemella haemolysans]|nr:LPXTG cell wall anchor domain-containing protein [Gemella haemolysans]